MCNFRDCSMSIPHQCILGSQLLRLSAHRTLPEEITASQARNKHLTLVQSVTEMGSDSAQLR